MDDRLSSLESVSSLMRQGMNTIEQQGRKILYGYTVYATKTSMEGD